MSIDEKYVYASVMQYYFKNFQIKNFASVAQVVDNIITAYAIPYKMVSNVGF
jgi:hypothetical protein